MGEHFLYDPLPKLVAPMALDLAARASAQQELFRGPEACAQAGAVATWKFLRGKNSRRRAQPCAVWQRPVGHGPRPGTHRQRALDPRERATAT